MTSSRFEEIVSLLDKTERNLNHKPNHSNNQGGKEMRMTMKKLTQGATRLAAALSLVDFSFGGKGAS